MLQSKKNASISRGVLLVILKNYAFFAEQQAFFSPVEQAFFSSLEHSSFLVVASFLAGPLVFFSCAFTFIETVNNATAKIATIFFILIFFKINLLIFYFVYFEFVISDLGNAFRRMPKRIIIIGYKRFFVNQVFFFFRFKFNWY